MRKLTSCRRPVAEVTPDLPASAPGRGSPAARYLVAVLAGALVSLPLLCAATWLAISWRLVDSPDLQIYYHQLAKIDGARRVDVLLVGDSTLGNAVDERAWSAKTGKAILALPLTGGYGYAGSLNMIRRVLERHRPEVVVLMQSLDMATRSIAWEGALVTAERPSDLRGLPPWQLVAALARVDRLQAALRTLIGGSAAAARLAGRDYWPQAPREQSRHELIATRTPKVADIRPEKFAYLRRIGALCQAARITCLYAHGPFVDPQCSEASAYLRVVNAAIEDSGLQVVPGTPRCMSLDQAGDSEDHVRPALKTAFSEAYRALVAEVLAADAKPGYLSRADAAARPRQPPGRRTARLRLPAPS